MTDKEIATNKKSVQQIFHPSFFLKKDTNDTGEVEAETGGTPKQVANKLDWQRVPISRQNKKRKANSPPAETLDVSNSFSELPVDQTEEKEQRRSKKPTKPPPIVLYGIEDVNKLTKLLETVAESSKFAYKIVNKNQLRVICENTEIYKQIIALVRENELIGHTFNLKGQRCYRVVIKNLHHTTPHEAIIEAIENTGNMVSGEIINARAGPEKKPTSTFFVNITPGPDNKSVKDIKVIHHQVVTIEDPRKRKTVVQCQRCQQYGHSKNYCLRPYRCVKCGQSHKTSECTKVDRNTPATCALCFGPHPANYKGCQVYKEIQARKIQQRKPVYDGEKYKKYQPNTESTSLLSQQTNTKNYNMENIKLDTTKRTYAEITNSHHKGPSIDPQHKTMDNTSGASNVSLLEKLIASQSAKFDFLLQQMSVLMSLMTQLINKLK